MAHDTGCGIPKDKWERIFLYPDSENSPSGYGLKRSIAILNTYGGILKVKKSEIDIGTTMVLSLKINRT